MRSRRVKQYRSAAARRLLDLAPDASTVEDAVRVVVSDLLQGVAHPPTDLDGVAKKLKARIDIEKLSIAGELRPDGEGFRVVCSSYQSAERRRFSIAHELGHALFSTTGPNWPRRGKELERICDLLATEMLMPADLFIHAASSTPFRLQRVFELKRVFRTSLQATAVRCNQLLGTNVFEVKNHKVRFGCREIPKGPLLGINQWLAPAVERSLNGEAVSTTLYLRKWTWSGEWFVEGFPIGRGNRALFLIRPVPRRVGEPATRPCSSATID